MPASPPVAINDISAGFSSWRIWSMLAVTDIRQRYRRSRLGQFWFTLSVAIMVFGMGAVYSILFNAKTAIYVPYIAVSFVLWGFISTTINESANAFIENERIILHTHITPSTVVFRLIYRNLLILAHNILVIPIAFAVFGVGINANILWLIPGFVLVVLNCFWISFVLAIIGARYRDVPQIVTSVTQLLFFVTPVVYMPDQLASHLYIVRMNPLASFLEIVREPILGHAPSMEALGISLGVLIVGFLLTLFFAGRYGRRVVYWL
jgi:lipopolysaccharide transport system permease protein